MIFILPRFSIHKAPPQLSLLIIRFPFRKNLIKPDPPCRYFSIYSKPLLNYSFTIQNKDCYKEPLYDQQPSLKNRRKYKGLTCY